MASGYRVPSNAHPVDSSAGRTFAPGEVVKESDLQLKADPKQEGADEANVAHDQRLVDEVLIEVPAKAKSSGGDS